MSDGLLIELRQKTVQLLEAIDSGADSAPSELGSQGADAKSPAENLGRADSARGEDHRVTPGAESRPVSSPVDDTVRLREALAAIAEGRWNTGTGRNLTAREFAREALSVDAGNPEAENA